MFLLAWLPVQAVAVPLVALRCHDGDHAAAPVVVHDCHEQPQAADEGASPDHDGDEHGLNTGHLCCPHFSAMPTNRFGIFAEPTSFQAPMPVFHAYSFFPEQPQRPPRT